MSENLCYMAGYGISLTDLYNLLNDEYKEDCDNCGIDIFDDINRKTEISTFENDDNSYLYIRDTAPYAPLFKSIEEADEYFYNNLKPFLKSEVTKEQLAELLDDVFDYYYC